MTATTPPRASGPGSSGRAAAVPTALRPVRALAVVPAERARPPRRRQIVAFVLAVVLPICTAAAMIPWRTSHGRTLALVLVVPVVLVATIGTAAPGILAALVAGLSFDFFLTAPYYHLRIEDSDEVAATITLVVVGIAVGLLSSRATRLGARASARQDELRHLLAFATATAAAEVHATAAPGAAPAPAAEDLLQDAAQRIAALLHLRSCTWVAGPHDISRPILLPTGDVMGFLTDLHPDRSRLPAVLELPAPAGAAGPGRFVLEADPEQVVSHEERLTAATIASMCTAALRATAPAD